MANNVRLQGGPFAGLEVPRPGGLSLLCELPDNPDVVARYRWHRGQRAFTFREYDRVVGRIPAPQAAA